MSLTNEYRINYYLGNLRGTLGIPKNCKSWMTRISGKLYNYPNLDRNYIQPFLNLLRKSLGAANAEKVAFALLVGDIEPQKISVVTNDTKSKQLTVQYETIDKFHNVLRFCLLKNRIDILPKEGVILKSMNRGRHWGIHQNMADVVPFQKKKNKLVWRGATTGDASKTANRFLLVQKWFHEQTLADIGFNKLVQDPKKYGTFFQKHSIKNFVRNTLSRKQLLEYKYILSVRGNDKDSGLNWKLASNSVVFMARPTVNTWLMESELIPNYHYVQLRDDFSDLAQKIVWANQNPEKMRQISLNANQFMKMFENQQNEEKIEHEVIRRYFQILQRL